MRITNNQIFFTVLDNIQKPAKRMLEHQTQIATGKRINRHSDDPVSSGRNEQLKGRSANVKQYQRNIQMGQLWMQQTESSLDRVEANLTRAKALAIQGANATNSSDERATLAKEVNQILEDVFSVANSQFRGAYLFAGQNTTTQPFVATRNDRGEIASVSAAADLSGQINREIEDGVLLPINVTGNEVFNLSDGPMASLIQLRDSLQANEITGIQSSIDTVQKALEKSLDARTGLGARMNRMEAAMNHLQSYEVDLSAAISTTEDADIAEMAMRIASDEASYRAALGAASRIVQNSLVDFLT